MSQEKQRSRTRPDDLPEDAFGLNIRGIKTIWALFANPSAVFSAAEAPDWKHTYTPSIRLWFSMIAVLLFFQFIWAGESSFLQDSYRRGLEGRLDGADGRSIDDIIDQMMDYYTLILPLVTVVFMLVASCLTYIWGKGQPFVTRIRLFFLGLIPDAAVTVFFSIVVALTTFQYALAIGVLALSSTLLLSFFTVFRGLAGIGVLNGRLWRSALYAVIVLVFTMASNIAAQIIAGVLVRQQL